MATEANQSQHVEELKAGVLSAPAENSFTFEPISTAPPIKFNPDTPDRSTATSLGSLSSLSSTVTPEGITLTIKRTANSAEQLSPNGRSRSNNLALTTGREASSETTTPGGNRQMMNEPIIDQESLIEVAQSKNLPSAPYQAPTIGQKPSGKLTTRYVMPDGSLITGRGLGRGRPGVKRGPRSSRAPGEESADDMPSVAMQTPESSEAPTGAKRKRTISEASVIRAESLSSSLSSRQSSIEYSPAATQTRSGRQTQKPVSIITVEASPSVNASPASKKISAPTVPAPALKSHPKIKRKVYRGKEQSALCEHCLRGYGPPGNVIVFCDACNKCWHQRCHQPQIPKEIVIDTKAEWFCATCDKILHGNKKSKKPPPPKLESSQPVPAPEQKFGPPLVGAIALTLEQRQKYLESLSREKLIAMLLRAGELAPQMPIFETPIPLPRIGPHLQPQFTSDYVTPVTETLPNQIKTGSTEVADEGYDDTYDEHAALYPKTGEGVKLPPEREDLNMLLEGPDSRTFSHWIKGQPVKTAVDTVPLHLSWPEYARAINSGGRSL